MANGGTNSLALTRKRFRLFLYLGLPTVTSITLLAVVLQQLYASPKVALFTESADAIVFQGVTTIGTALIGALSVGALFEAYQARYSDQAEELSTALNKEGLVAIHRNADDPNLVSALESAIKSAHDEIFALGLGLGVLHNNRGLLSTIADRINATSNLTVLILVGSAANEGVKTRVEEERAWHASKGINYDPNWVTNFPNEIRTVISVLTDVSRRSRIKVVDAAGLPMLGLVKIDDRYFFFPYGSPDIRGSESPWIELVDDAGQSGHILRFMRRTVEYFKSTAP